MSVHHRVSWLKGCAVLGLSTVAWAAFPAAGFAHDDLPGTPAAHHPIWQAWNWDPLILVSLVVSAWVYRRGVTALWRRAGRGRGIRIWQAASFAVGLVALFLALISPVDWLASKLFSMHMVQHMLLIFVAAPLLVFGKPHLAFLWALPVRGRRALAQGWRRVVPLRRGWHALTHPASAWLLHVGALWVWHIPGFYEAALVDEWVHALEHLAFLATAVLFWWVLAQAGVRRRMGHGIALLSIFAIMIQGTILGALITFAPMPWYPAYGLEGPVLWGLSPLEDQQLAGVIMWLPGGPIYLVAFLVVMSRWLRASEREAQRSQPVPWTDPGHGAWTEENWTEEKERGHVAQAQLASSE